MQKLKCSACGKESSKKPKPEPKHGREAKEVYFICRGCGARNLRDGTARMPKKQEKAGKLQEKQQAEPKKEPERSEVNGSKPEQNLQEAAGYGFYRY